jgi:urea transport system permease protein
LRDPVSLGHFAFFGLGGYMIGMWLMYARTEADRGRLAGQCPIPPTPQEMRDAIATQIFGVVGGSRLPADLGLCRQR